MIEINLVPDVKQELIKAQRVRATVISFAIIIGIVSIGIVTVLSVYVFGFQTIRKNLADSAITDGAKKLTSVTDLSKTLTLQNQLTKLTELNANKNIDSRIFNVLAAIIPPAPNNVQVSTLTIDSSTSTVSIEGQAANSYAAVEVFKKTIEGAQVKYTNSGSTQEVALASNVSTTNTSYGEDSTGAKVLRFTLSFNYATQLFTPSSTNLTVVITTNGNATDSFLGVPTSVFTTRAADLGTGAGK
jgi:Tfp pilus assembly protein PilN